MHHFSFTPQPTGGARFYRRRQVIAVAIVLVAPFLFSGCEQKTSQRLTPQQAPESTVAVRAYRLSVLLVGYDRLAQPIRRQWTARQDADFDLETISVATFAANDYEIPPGTDVILYPPDLLMELIHRGRIVELNRSVYDSESFNRTDLLTHFRKSGIRYDSKTWAVPCGSPLLAMIYQPRALALAGDRLPTTWKQLVRWGQRLAAASVKPASGDGGPESPQVPGGIGVPLAQGWATKTFFAIAAPAVRQKGRLSVMFDRKTMKPLIDSEGFVDALESLKILAGLNPGGIDQTPADVFGELVAGNLAAGITWPHRAGTISNSAAGKNGQGRNGQGPMDGPSSADPKTADPKTDVAAMLMVGPLPGSDTYFDVLAEAWGTRPRNEPDVVNFHGLGGLLASQTKQSRRPQSAVEFLKWVSESSISQTLFAGDAELGPFRMTHLADPQAWLGDGFSVEFENAYATHLKQAHQHALIMTMPNILKRSAYLAILDQEIRKYLQTDRTAKETLQSVSRQWEALTETVGRKNQSNILRRNSNF